MNFFFLLHYCSGGDLGRNFQYSAGNQNTNLYPHGPRNLGPNRSFNRLANRGGDHSHYMRSYQRRSHFPNNRQMPYLPHQWLYNRQQVMQEIYRRHMFSDFDTILYDNPYFLPYPRSRDNYHGLGIGDRAPIGSYYWPRRR